jgi:hypothetical protein
MQILRFGGDSVAMQRRRNLRTDWRATLPAQGYIVENLKSRSPSQGRSRDLTVNGIVTSTLPNTLFVLYTESSAYVVVFVWGHILMLYHLQSKCVRIIRQFPRVRLIHSTSSLSSKSLRPFLLADIGVGITGGPFTFSASLNPN